MSTSVRYTVKDVERLPDLEGVRYELIDGELHVAKQPTSDHQYACVEVASALRNWNGESRAGVTLYAPGVIFSDDNAVAPDVVWVSRERYLTSLDKAHHLTAPPEIVVEVLSLGAANQRRDRELKLGLYSRRGVDEYWLVDLCRRSVQVYRRGQRALELTAELTGDDVLTSPILPGFSYQVGGLWELPF